MVITLYHYTTKDGMDAIMASRRIRCSKDFRRDAKLGKGIYFCDLPPESKLESTFPTFKLFLFLFLFFANDDLCS